MRLKNYHFTKEGAYQSRIYGLRYELGEDVLLDIEIAPDVYQLVGLSPDGEMLLGASVEKTWGILWKVETGDMVGSIISRECENPVNAFIVADNLVVGLCMDERIEEVSVLLRLIDGNIWDHTPEDEIYHEVTAVVDEDGFFYMFDKMENHVNWEYLLDYVESRDTTGQIVYQYGINRAGEHFFPE